MNKKKSLILFSLIALFSSCDASKDLIKAYNMVTCKYEFNSISRLNISSMDLSNGFSLAQLPQITSLLSGNQSSIPVNFDLNLDVNNPNTSEALLHGLQYIISIDDIDFTQGSVNNPLQIAAGSTQVLPINIGVDLVQLMDKNSKSAVLYIARNLAGIGNKSSKVTVKIKPSFLIKNIPVSSPAYIPINFNVGGAK